MDGSHRIPFCGCAIGAADGCMLGGSLKLLPCRRPGNMTRRLETAEFFDPQTELGSKVPSIPFSRIYVLAMAGALTNTLQAIYKAGCVNMLMGKAQISLYRKIASYY
ncbi:hypothetical protein Tco_0155556 [Tanacetum coccineum]